MSIIILNVTNIRLEGITFENCSSNYSDYLHTAHDVTTISKLGNNASILLYHCTLVKIIITVTEGSTGMVVINAINYSNITNIRITVQTNCLSINKSSLQINGTLLYYDNWKNPCNKSSDIQLDNFQFTTNGSCSHPILYYAITSLLFQNNANVSVVIQNTMFNDLINVTALYYYGETCGIGVSKKLTIRNCIVSNNIGNPSFKMFHVTLYNIQCITLFKPKQLYYLQQYYNISFMNCKFEIILI